MVRTKSEKARSKAKRVGLWVLTGLLAFAFLGAGGSKLAAAPPQVEGFVRWGLPLWFMYVTGALEVLTAILLIVPRTATLGAALAGATMIGAVVTLLNAGEISHAVVPLLVLALSAVVVIARRHELLPAFNRLVAGRGAQEIRA